VCVRERLSRRELGQIVMHDSEAGETFREGLGFRLNQQTFESRLILSRMLQHAVWHLRYKQQFFELSEGVCRHALGLMPRGGKGYGSTGFQLSPSELRKHPDTKMEARLPQPVSPSTECEGGVGTHFMVDDMITWRWGQPTYTACLATALCVLYMLNLDAAKNFRKEGMTSCAISCPLLTGLATDYRYVDTVGMSTNGDSAAELRAHYTPILDRVKQLNQTGLEYRDAKGVKHKKAVKFMYVNDGKGEHCLCGGMGSHGTHPCVRCPIAARDLNDTSKIWPLSGEEMDAMKQLAAAAKLRHTLQGKGELNDAEKTKVTNASLGYNAEDLSRMDIWCH